MDGLSINNILSPDEVNDLFDDNNAEEEVVEQTTEPTEEKQEKETKNETTEVNVDTLFTEEPESVGSGDDDNEEKEDTTPEKDGTSPKTNFYSSIAKALKEEGIFPDLDDEVVSNTKKAEDFRDLIEQQIKAGFDERQKRIDTALGVGIEPDDIRKYESTLDYFDSIEEDTLTSESEEGEKLRKQLIYQDFINRGFTKDKALKYVKKSFDTGSDIEDAKEALESNKEFFQEQYDKLINDAKAQEEAAIKERQVQSEKLKKSILEDKDVFGDLSIDKSTRKKIYDNISKPVYKDPKTGNMYTAIQKYQMENSTDFLKNLGLVYTLTNGFKDFDSLVKNKVKKEVKKGLRNLERVLSTSTTSDGNIGFVGIGSDDPESGKWDLDI